MTSPQIRPVPRNSGGGVKFRPPAPNFGQAPGAPKQPILGRRKCKDLTDWSRIRKMTILANSGVDACLRHGACPSRGAWAILPYYPMYIVLVYIGLG